MGLFDPLRREKAGWTDLEGRSTFDPAQRNLAPSAPGGSELEPFWGTAGIPVMDPGVPFEFYAGPLNGSAEKDGLFVGRGNVVDMRRNGVDGFWRTQPQLRKVIDFIARNVASTPINAYNRTSDIERERLHDGPLAHLMKYPQRGLSPYRFWHGVLSDGLLYDKWAILFSTTDFGPELVHLPSWRLNFVQDDLGRIIKIRYWMPATKQDDAHWRDLPMDQVVFDHGYAPKSAGLSPVETLRDVLDESAESVRNKRDLYQNGARIPGYVGRPVDAPKWDNDKRSRFVEALREWRRGGARTNTLPLLEDGMEIKAVNLMSPKDMLDIDGRKLSAIEVCTAFHIAPELVGAREGTYSNMDAMRQMLFGPSLGPYIAAWEGALNSQLVPMLLGYDSDVYVEANVDSKLRGSFQEQATIMQSATGGPWLTRNEARAMQNRPPLDGADELIVPLNVVTGGLASPNDTAPPKGIEVKSAGLVTPGYESLEALLVKHFTRQKGAILPFMGAKSEWWDEERWNRELAEDLLPVLTLIAEKAARRTMDSHGIPEGSFDASVMTEYLKAKAAGAAAGINGGMRKSLEDAEEPAHAFEVAIGGRSSSLAQQLATATNSFGAIEVGKQTGAVLKTWHASGPDSRHADLDGESVGLGQPFSSGLSYPGLGSDPNEVAGCKCSVSISYREE